MEKKKNHYENLSVSRQASLAEIRMAYRRQASKHHPDRNPGSQSAANAMVLINEAYSVLKNPERRMTYDAWLEEKGTPRDVFGTPAASTSGLAATTSSSWYSSLAFKVSLAFILVMIWVVVKN